MRAILVVCVSVGFSFPAWAGTNPFRPPAFYDAGDVTTGEAAYSVTSCDWDRDGVPDLLVSRSHTDSILVLRNNHEGMFTPLGSFWTPYGPGAIEAKDLNKDGVEDIVVGTIDDAKVSIYLSNETGYEAQWTIEFGSLVQDFEFGDWDQDKDIDIAVCEGLFGSVRILINDGSGHFTWTGSVIRSGGIPQMALGDFNEDGLSDLVIPSPSVTNRLEFLYGNGSGGFQVTSIPSVPDRGRVGVVAADMNGDNHLDLVTTESIVNTVTVWLGNGTGAFVSQAPVAPVAELERLASGDLDGDGDIDVVVGSTSWTVTALFNDGSGQLTEMTTMPIGSSPFRPMLKDLDLNGFADLAVCLSVSDSVAVLLNVNGAVVPTLVSAIGYVFLDGRLTITWESSALRSVTASVYRQEESVWHRKGIASRDGVDGFRWFDHDVVPGQSYRYRLGIVEGAGEIPAGEVTIEIPSVVHFGVTMIGANPSSGVIRCAVDLETDELTTLSLWDISGRRIASRNVGTYGLGHHVVDLTDGVTLAPGVYVVSLEDGRQAKSLRVSVVR